MLLRNGFLLRHAEALQQLLRGVIAHALLPVVHGGALNDDGKVPPGLDRHGGHRQPDAEDPVIAFSTTNYHVFRAGILAADLGMNVDGMGAKTKWYFWPNALIREFVGMLVREWKLHLSLLIVIATLSVFSANLQWLFELF